MPTGPISSGPARPGSLGPSSTASLVVTSESAGQASSLKVGAFVFLTVRDRLGPDNYSLAIGNKLITANSQTPLALGSVLRAQVERGGMLRLLGSELPGANAGSAAKGAVPGTAAEALLSTAGLPNDAAARAALAALLGAGLAPEARALARVRFAALRGEHEGRGEEYAELAAQMEGKGLVAEGGLFEEIAALSDGRSGSGSGSWGGGSANGDAGRGGMDSGVAGDEGPAPEAGSPSEGFDLSRDFELELDPADIPAVLGSLLSAIVTCAEEEGGKLALFNHLAGKQGAWLLAPFRLYLGAVDLAGNLRIQLPCSPGGPGRLEAYFSAAAGPSCAGEDWSLFVSFGGSRPPSLRLVAPTMSEALVSRSGELASALAEANCSLVLESRDSRSSVGEKLDMKGFDADA